MYRVCTDVLSFLVYSFIPLNLCSPSYPPRYSPIILRAFARLHLFLCITKIIFAPLRAFTYSYVLPKLSSRLCAFARLHLFLCIYQIIFAPLRLCAPSPVPMYYPNYLRAFAPLRAFTRSYVLPKLVRRKLIFTIVRTSA